MLLAIKKENLEDLVFDDSSIVKVNGDYVILLSQSLNLLVFADYALSMHDGTLLKDIEDKNRYQVLQMMDSYLIDLTKVLRS